MSKWHIICDQWNNAFKNIADQKKSGAAANKLKRYIYHEQLRFFNKTTALNETESNFCPENTNPEVAASSERQNDEMIETVKAKQSILVTPSEKSEKIKETENILNSVF